MSFLRKILDIYLSQSLEEGGIVKVAEAVFVSLGLTKNDHTWAQSLEDGLLL
jgi:hypothetical protein